MPIMEHMARLTNHTAHIEDAQEPYVITESNQVVWLHGIGTLKFMEVFSIPVFVCDSFVFLLIQSLH